MLACTWALGCDSQKGDRLSSQSLQCLALQCWCIQQGALVFPLAFSDASEFDSQGRHDPTTRSSTRGRIAHIFVTKSLAPEVCCHSCRRHRHGRRYPHHYHCHEASLFPTIVPSVAFLCEQDCCCLPWLPCPLRRTVAAADYWMGGKR